MSELLKYAAATPKIVTLNTQTVGGLESDVTGSQPKLAGFDNELQQFAPICNR